MPKLEAVRLGVSPITERVMMGTLRTPTEWREKRDCTSDFCAALLEWCPPGFARDVTASDGKKYEVVVRAVKAPNAQAQRLPTAVCGQSDAAPGWATKEEK